MIVIRIVLVSYGDIFCHLPCSSPIVMIGCTSTSTLSIASVIHGEFEVAKFIFSGYLGLLKTDASSLLSDR